MNQEEKTIENQQPEVEPQATATATEQSATSAESSNHRKRDHKRRASKHDDSTEKLQEMGEKLADAQDKYVRLYSEYENYRKRTNMEKADLIINGSKDMIKAILPVVDDMERALQAMTEDDAAKEGVQLIFNKMMNILSQKGLKPIEAKGQKFDENLHEAVTQFPASEEGQKGTVMDVVEKGYYLNDKVLRYAKVVVAV